jgi:hypothetical protein
MVIYSKRLPDGDSQGVDQRAIWRAQLVAQMSLDLQMGPIFDFTTDFNPVTKQDVSDVNLPPLRESLGKVCFIYIIFHGVFRGYETVYRSSLEACSFFRRAIGLRSKSIAMVSTRCALLRVRARRNSRRNA